MESDAVDVRNICEIPLVLPSSRKGRTLPSMGQVEIRR